MIEHFDKKSYVNQLPAGGLAAVLIVLIMTGGVNPTAEGGLEKRVIILEQSAALQDTEIALNTQASFHYGEMQLKTNEELKKITNILFQLCQGMAADSGVKCTT